MSAATVTESDTDSDVIIDMEESSSTDIDVSTVVRTWGRLPWWSDTGAGCPFPGPVERWDWLSYPELLEECMGEESTAWEICSNAVWRLANWVNHNVFVKEYFVLVKVHCSLGYMEYKRRVEGRSDWFIPCWTLPIAYIPSVRDYNVRCEIIR